MFASINGIKSGSLQDFHYLRLNIFKRHTFFGVLFHYEQYAKSRRRDILKLLAVNRHCFYVLFIGCIFIEGQYLGSGKRIDPAYQGNAEFFTFDLCLDVKILFSNVSRIYALSPQPRP